MPKNIEIKARVRDAAALEAAVRGLHPGAPQVIPQEDVFFACPEGLLKLRILAPDAGQLVHYARAAGTGPRPSRYALAPTSDPAALRRLLAGVLGERGVVRKVRRLFLVGQTRVHLDRVEGLGDFLELEVVLREGQPEAEGVAVAEGLMRALGVAPGDLLGNTYFELLRERNAAGAGPP